MMPPQMVGMPGGMMPMDMGMGMLPQQQMMMMMGGGGPAGMMMRPPGMMMPGA